jgi:hypothetical protein
MSSKPISFATQALFLFPQKSLWSLSVLLKLIYFLKSTFFSLVMFVLRGSVFARN